jgi:hypothetical protein
MDCQEHFIAFGSGMNAEISTLADDPLIAHQTGKPFLQVTAAHHRITHHIEGRWPQNLRHIQANGRVARNLNGQVPEAGHGILGKARIGIGQRCIVEPQLGKQAAAVNPAKLQGRNNARGPTG